MGIAPVIAGDALARGLRTEFLGNYRQDYKGLEARLGNVMRLGISSSNLEELYVYPRSAPFPQRQPRGEAVSAKGYQFDSFTIENVAWAKRIQWHKDDREFDNTGALVTQARQLGSNFATLPERVFFQLVQGTTDSRLLASVPNAPDGAALYATTAAGSARFGATNGNLLTGSGVATSGAIRTDYFSGIQQFALFQDTEGEPLWDPSTIDAGVTIIYGAANEQVFREAFQQGVTALAASTATSNAGVSNVILDSGLKVNLVSTQRITDNDWYMFLNGAETKAIVEQVATPLEETIATEQNSDLARDTQIESVQWRTLRGYGINLPTATIKVNN